MPNKVIKGTCKELTERQYSMLSSLSKSDIYVTYGNLSESWWIVFAQADKYLGGYETKEEAEQIIKDGGYLVRDLKWYAGNSLVL